MPSITLKSHYDGQHLLLDEPFDLPINSPLMVIRVELTNLISHTIPKLIYL